MTTDNAAARLLAVLAKGKQYSVNRNAKDTWGAIFELEASIPNYESILMSKLGQVMLLPYETRLLVEQYYPHLAPTLEHTLEQVQYGFVTQNLSSSWATFINSIDTHCLNSLSMAAELLNHKLETKLIEDEELVVFKNQVKDILDETITSSLSHEFKKFMTHYLQKILNAINDYLISGAMPILDAIESTLGHAVLDPKFRDELAKTETGHNISTMLGNLANVVTIATAATGAAAFLATNGIPLLLG